MNRRRTPVVLLLAGALLGACSTSAESPGASPSVAAPSVSAPATASDVPTESASAVPSPTEAPSPSEPAVGGIYAGPASGVLDPRVANLPPRAYVPNEGSNDVAVIDPETFEIVGRFAAGAAQTLSPDWDFSKLYVSNMNGASLTIIDPETEEVTDTMQVPFPYNVFFTPRRVQGDHRGRLPRHRHGRRQRPLFL